MIFGAVPPVYKQVFKDFLFFPVSQLREHWEDTSEKVNSRKSQLEDLLVDNQQFESKRREVESWLKRMEAWKERMGPVATSPDIMEAQIREQKVKKKTLPNTASLKIIFIKLDF